MRALTRTLDRAIADLDALTARGRTVRLLIAIEDGACFASDHDAAELDAAIDAGLVARLTDEEGEAFCTLTDAGVAMLPSLDDEPSPACTTLLRAYARRDACTVHEAAPDVVAEALRNGWLAGYPHELTEEGRIACGLQEGF